MDDATFRHITERVFKLIKLDPQYITRADLPSVDQTASDQALEARVADLENDVFNTAGALPSLSVRVERLELSRSATSVEMGGFVFTDEASVDAWLAPVNDPRLNRFCVDFTILFLLAEPKFESISQGLEQTAAAKKAHFESLDLATIDLSYKIVYPPRILIASEKEAAMENDNVEWATPFATHSGFEGTYNNGTHLRLKKSIKGVVRAMQGGLDASYPPRLHPKVNGVFKQLLHTAEDQCLGFLDSCTPLWRKISGGGMSDKEAWSRVLVFVKQVFDDVAAVRAINSEETLGSKVWASLCTTQMLKSYQLNNWVEHYKTSAILAVTSMRKEGKAIEQMGTTLGAHTSTIQSHTNQLKKINEELKELKKKNPSLA
jgi:hypothetical protein